MPEHWAGNRTRHGFTCACGRAFHTVEARDRHLSKVVVTPPEERGSTTPPGVRPPRGPSGQAKAQS